MAGTSKTKEEPAAPAEAAKDQPPALPTEMTTISNELHEKMVVLYGPPGVGKTTLAAQWAGGGGFFFNTAGELGDLVVFQQAIPNWNDFRRYSWALAEAAKKDGKPPYPCGIIDTADVLGRYCSEVVRKRLGVAHESDADFGKGYQALRDEFSVSIAKLAALPHFGVVFVAHADERTVKTRSSEYDKWQIRGVKSIRETMLDMADLVLFIDFTEGEDEIRTIKTKPSRYWDAKERGQSPRLPAEIPWPIGENGWDLINGIWQAAA